MGLLSSDPFLGLARLFSAKTAETAPPGGAPGPMASVVPGQVSSAPTGPVATPAPIPHTNPLTGATASNPGVVTQANHSPGAKKANFQPMPDDTQYHAPYPAPVALPMERTFMNRMKNKVNAYFEGLGDFTLDRLEENNRVSQRPGDPSVFAPESRSSPQI